MQSITGTANKIEVSGRGTEGRPVTLTLPSTVQIAQDLTVGGNLTVNGDLTYLNTTDLQIQDNLFELNAGLTGAPTNDSGMLVQRGTETNQIFMWDESVDKFTLGATASEDGARGNISVTVGTLVANIENDKYYKNDKVVKLPTFYDINSFYVSNLFSNDSSPNMGKVMTKSLTRMAHNMCIFVRRRSQFRYWISPTIPTTYRYYQSRFMSKFTIST